MDHLDNKVLVLNKLWIPIKVASVKRCLKLLFSDKAAIVLPSDYSVYNWEKWVDLDATSDKEKIKTTRGFIKIPEVIVLSKYDKINIRKARLTKKNIFLRDKNLCQYSGKKLSLNDADIDHIIPKSKGGENTWDNLVVCSKEINRRKGNKTPEEAGLRLIKKPTKPTSLKLVIENNTKMPESWKKFIENFNI